MTTAVWSAKHGQLGADKLISGWLTGGKIFAVGHGAYLTGAGFYDDIVEVAKWLKEGGKEDNKPTLAERDDAAKDSDFILVESNGKAYWLTCPFLRKVEITDQYYAVGTGAVAAMAALEAGATVHRALAIAAKYDNETGTKTTVISIPEKKPVKKR